MDLFQPLISDAGGLAGLLGLLPVEVTAALVSLATSILAMLVIRMASRQEPSASTGHADASHTFRLLNGQLLPLPDGREEILRNRGGVQTGDLLLFHDAEGVPEALAALESDGTAFSFEFTTPDRRAFDVSGRPSGNTALVTISQLGGERRKALELAEKLKQASDRNRCAMETLDKVPVPVWQQDSAGALTWSNAAYRALNEHGAVSQTLAAGKWPREPSGSVTRIQIPGPARTRWLDVSDYAFGPHGTIGLAIDVTPQVEAEASLSRFVETLTATFAHLPIGLAIFDHDRRLGMFNPALGDLLKLDAAWLAGQPTLREFLEHLRENRQMPDQRDFISWRRQLSVLEEGAANGSYAEIWVLPSGQNFRVTGRPHPQGALAFLFEDISGAVQLEERRRAETALNQTLMDRLSEAIAVFDTGARLSFCNTAFRDLWGSGGPDLSGRPGIAAMIEHWQSRSEDTGVWAELRSFASGATDRTSWTAGVRLRGGPDLTCLFAPMPEGSTLVVFQAGAGDHKPEKPGELEGIVSETDGVDPLKFFTGLEDILLPRGVRLDTAQWDGAPGSPAPTRGLRRIAWNMILAVVEFAPEAKLVSIAREGVAGPVTITAKARKSGSAVAGEGGVAVRVLRQFVDRQGGTLAIDQPTARRPLCIRCALPQQTGQADPPLPRHGQVSNSASSA